MDKKKLTDWGKNNSYEYYYNKSKLFLFISDKAKIKIWTDIPFIHSNFACADWTFDYCMHMHSVDYFMTRKLRERSKWNSHQEKNSWIASQIPSTFAIFFILLIIVSLQCTRIYKNYSYIRDFFVIGIISSWFICVISFPFHICTLKILIQKFYL